MSTDPLLRYGELTARLSGVLDTHDQLVDAVRRLEARRQVLEREMLDARREGEVLGLTRALAFAHQPENVALRERLKAEIARLAWEV